MRDDLIRSYDTFSLQLPTKNIGHPLVFFESCLSTNTACFQEAERGASHGTLVLADSQTSGRGRKGRAWYSPRGKNLYFSILLTQLPVQSGISWIPLVTGLALTETLEKITSLAFSLKWPNDILFKNKKMAGILCECKQAGKAGSACVVGVGININSTYGDFSPDLSEIATSLFIECQFPFNRSVVLTSFLEKFESYYENLLKSGAHSMKIPYTRRCSTIGRQIRIELMTGESIQGIAVGIGDEGELLVSESEKSSESLVVKVREGDVIHLR